MAVNNPYIFGDRATDRQRLEMQNFLYSTYLRTNLARIIGPQVRKILELGCGEGQLGRVMREVYPQAALLGIDKDADALARARQIAHEVGLHNAEYRLADIEAGFPPGPFDLIYAAFVLFDTRQPDRVIQQAYRALRPGGFLWIKDIPPDYATAINHRSYHKLAEMTDKALAAIGAHPEIMKEVAGLMSAAGFVDIREEVEVYALGGATPEGQAMLAVQLGVFHNARAVVSKIGHVPESEIERLYLDVCNAALHSTKELGSEQQVNIIAQRPIAG
ncbi:MAG TPA: methyltransferase domain-containing protein [Chloroflexia bacterium]|nr:methyltransferase domain-containing protein [Chloroflexia bacterium]